MTAPPRDLHVRLPELARHAERYATVPATPMRVTVQLVANERIASYDPVALDGLLSWCVVQEATGGRPGLPETAGAYNIPLPLAALWRSPEGWPLWAATQLIPEPEAGAYTDTHYWHKRAQTGAWTRAPERSKTGRWAVTSTNGRWMERRVPLTATACDRWQADAIGDPQEVARLLAMVERLGKRRTQFGLIDSLCVAPLPGGFRLVRDGRLTRPIPAAAAADLLGDELRPEGDPALVAWTVPEWKPALFRPGWPLGTPVSVGE